MSRDMRSHFNNDGMDPDYKPREQKEEPPMNAETKEAVGLEAGAEERIRLAYERNGDTGNAQLRAELAKLFANADKYVRVRKEVWLELTKDDPSETQKSPLRDAALSARKSMAQEVVVPTESSTQCVTVWKSGENKLWGGMDAFYAQADEDWLCNIPLPALSHPQPREVAAVEPEAGTFPVWEHEDFDPAVYDEVARFLEKNYPREMYPRWYSALDQAAWAATVPRYRNLRKQPLAAPAGYCIVPKEVSDADEDLWHAALMAYDNAVKFNQRGFSEQCDRLSAAIRVLAAESPARQGEEAVLKQAKEALEAARAHITEHHPVWWKCENALDTIEQSTYTHPAEPSLPLSVILSVVNGECRTLDRKDVLHALASHLPDHQRHLLTGGKP